MSVWTIIAIVIGAIFLINLVRAIFSSAPPEEPKVSFQDLKAKKEARERSSQSLPSASAKPKPSFPCVKEMEVKGTYYRTSDEKAAARDVEVGDTLILDVEPDNPVDPNAVKVLTLEGIHIGYVQWDIAQFVKDNISHVKSCTVTKTTRHEIPYIHASISFSASECKQQSFTPEELTVSPEDKMRDLSMGIKKDYKYRYVIGLVEGTFEQTSEVIAKARALREGDKVVLKKSFEESEYYPYRLDVYTEDDCMIGFLYGSFAQEPFELFNYIYTSTVASTLDATGHGQIQLKIFLTNDKKRDQSTPGISMSIICSYRGPYPQLSTVDALKRSDPERALEIALPIAEKEKGINAKFLCCQIYRLQKDYESEREMILKILERIENVDPSQISGNEYSYLKSQIPSITKRLGTVESRINSKSRKKSDDTLADSKKNL